MKIETITKWRTSDGEEHGSKESAQYHALRIESVAKANAVLDGGGTVADALRAGGWNGSDIDLIFERVTKATKLIISHWQCRDTPGYQVQHITSHWKVFVWGDAGSWTGPYGNQMTFNDLARYASNTEILFASPNKSTRR